MSETDLRGVILATTIAGITHLTTVPVAALAPQPAAAARQLGARWPERDETRLSAADLLRGGFALRRRSGVRDLFLPVIPPEQRDAAASGLCTDRQMVQEALLRHLAESDGRPWIAPVTLDQWITGHYAGDDLMAIARSGIASVPRTPGLDSPADAAALTRRFPVSVWQTLMYAAAALPDDSRQMRALALVVIAALQMGRAITTVTDLEPLFGWVACYAIAWRAARSAGHA